MIAAISQALPFYCSGIKCWAAFCDAIGEKVDFPATESMVIKFSAIFTSPATFEQYVKHVRWAHRFLRMDCSWDTGAVKQVQRGAARSTQRVALKVALVNKQVQAIITMTMREGR